MKARTVKKNPLLANLLKNTLMFLHNVKHTLKSREVRTSYGAENPGKIFYVIGVPRDTMGLISLILGTLGHILYAVDHGYIPVVDLQNYNSQYLDKRTAKNVWEYFLEQPCGYSLQDIRHSKNIILSPKHDLFVKKYMLKWDTNIPRQYRKLFAKYIRFNKSTQDYLHADYKRLFRNKRKILGVLCRGTDYLFGRPPGHPVQPEQIQVAEKAEQILLKQKYSYLYLATEDEAIYALFKARFGRKLLTNRQKRFKQSRPDFTNGKMLYQIPMSVSRRHSIALDYLSSLNLLAHCGCFIGGLVSGTLWVYLTAAKFEYYYVWDLGRYPHDFKRVVKKYWQRVFQPAPAA
jgi:hypothetical protein